MKGENKVFLIGNVGNDPEVKNFDNGMVASFSLATSSTYKKKDGEKVTETEWHRVVAWNKVGEIVEKWVKKGAPLRVVGKLKTRTWETESGEKRYSTEVVMEDLILLGGNPNEQQEAKKETQTAGPANAPQPDEEDDLPF